MENVYDCVVIGAGIEGSWTAYQLSKRNQKTVLLEQFDLPHTRGSSQGGSRIIRKGYENKFEADLMNDAYREWRQLERDTGVELFVPTELLFLAKSGTGHTRNVENIIAGFQRTPDSKYTVLGADDLRTRFPTARFGSEYYGCLDHEAGLLKASKCLSLVQQMFIKRGGVIQDGTHVTHIEPGTTVTVYSNSGTYRAKSVVVCAGAWCQKVLDPLGLYLPVTVLKVSVFYWKVTGGCLPVSFSDSFSENCFMWGIPPLEYPGYVKIASHDGTNIDPDERDKGDTRHILKYVKEYIKEHFPGVDTKPAIVETCMYSETPDHVCILDKHPKHKNILFACGFSGSGFKLAPVFGEILADLASNKTPKHDITPFSLRRFSKSHL